MPEPVVALPHPIVPPLPTAVPLVRVTVRDEYAGPPVPLIWRSMPDPAPSFEQPACGLEQRAERSG